MQQVLFFGKADKLIPWSDGFEIQANGSIDFSVSGVNKLEIEKDKDINWIDLLYSELDNFASQAERFEVEYRSSEPSAVYDKYVSCLWDKLEQYCNPKSTAERDFFSLYCHLCVKDIHCGAFLPALIPNVYINWYFSKEERAKSKKPYVVDFVFKSSAFGTSNLVIVEIDGSSHYATYEPLQQKYIPSDEVYAEHLKKDRWLRKRGFKVFRIGNSEIRSITSLPKESQIKQFYYFFREVFGEMVVGIEEFHYDSFS